MAAKKGRPKLERRGSTRADASLSMRLEGRPDDGELTKIVTESENISSSGVYCSSPHYLAPLSKVALTIVLPNHGGSQGSSKLLKCDGIVVRCQPNDLGPRHHSYELACSFIGLDERHRVLLDDFVTWRNVQAIHRTQPPRGGTRPKLAGVKKSARGSGRRRKSAARAPRTRRAANR